MNTPKKEIDHGPIFEPFPEPRTLPGGWDLSTLLSESNPPVDVQFEDHSTH
jgi:hypothetical protein